MKLGPEYRFLILKSQQGNDGFDPWFERNMRAGIADGLEVFAYCFYYPLPVIAGKESRDPKRQAQLFVDRLHRYPEMRDRPIFLDYEWPPVIDTRPGKVGGWKEWKCSPQQISDSMEANAAEVQRLSGRAPVIYTYDDWWSSVRDGRRAYGYPTGADVSWAAEYPLWMAWYPYARAGVTARWPTATEKPKVPAPWKSWLFWQFDGNGGLRLPTGADSDFCVFNGDEEALQAFVRGPQPSRPVHSSGGPVIEDVAPRAARDVLSPAE